MTIRGNTNREDDINIVKAFKCCDMIRKLISPRRNYDILHRLRQNQLYAEHEQCGILAEAGELQGVVAYSDGVDISPSGRSFAELAETSRHEGAPVSPRFRSLI
jgi:hypothetical protein